MSTFTTTTLHYTRSFSQRNQSRKINKLKASHLEWKIYFQMIPSLHGHPWWLGHKESACNPRDVGSIPGSGRSPGEVNGYTLQYSCLGNSMDRGAQWATIHAVTRIRHDLATKHHHHHLSYTEKIQKIFTKKISTNKQIQPCFRVQHQYTQICLCFKYRTHKEN